MYKKNTLIRRFEFGEPNSYGGCCVIMARSFEEAKTQFLATSTNPIKFVCAEDRALDEKGYTIPINNTTEYESSFKLKENPRIKVLELVQNEQNEWEICDVHFVFLKECIEFDYSSFRKIGGLIGYTADNETEELVKSSNFMLDHSNKAELIRQRNELAKRQQELEIETRKLKDAILKLNDEISSKKKLLKGIEVYLGIGCDTFELLDGTPAKKEEKLHIHQEVCFIDEELSVWKDCWKIEGGADFNNLSDFEDFIKVHFKEYMPHPLSVLAWRIRRNIKEYGDIWECMAKQHLNFLSVILIRDGERLIELVPEIHLKEVFFPRTGDLDKVLEDARKWGREKEKLQEFYEKHMFSVLFLQGIIDNTELLPQRFKGENLFKCTSDNIVFVRDAEKDHWIPDGKPTWEEFREANRKTISAGSRCVFLGVPDRYEYYRISRERTGIRGISHPDTSEIYTIEEIHKSYLGSQMYRFLYMPHEEVYDEETFQYHKRMRKVSWNAYDDELLNIDELTIEDIDYYLKNRIYRQDYLRMMPALFLSRKILEQEKEEEENFKSFVRSRISFNVSDEEFDEAIKIFKTRKYGGKEERKWKRGILQDPIAAVKQIEQLLKKNQ